MQIPIRNLTVREIPVRPSICNANEVQTIRPQSKYNTTHLDHHIVSQFFTKIGLDSPVFANISASSLISLGT